jgi:competence protein ComEA
MLKKLLVLLSLCCAALAYAAVDVNQASEAELDGIKGIGPAMSARILQEREKAPFKDWADLIERVQAFGRGPARQRPQLQEGQGPQDPAQAA